MICSLRSISYQELLETLRGRRPAIVTCSVCIRISGIGGPKEAERLSAMLRSDGVDVIGTVTVSAPCLSDRADRAIASIPEGADCIVALVCEDSADLIAERTTLEVIKVTRTVGTCVVADGRVRLTHRSVDDDIPEDLDPGEVRRLGLWSTPFSDSEG